jgi:hypothetical protein
MQALLDRHFERIGTVEEFASTPYLVYRRRLPGTSVVDK